MENQFTQHFTNEELYLMSDVILAMQNCLTHADMMLFGRDMQKRLKRREMSGFNQIEYQNSYNKEKYDRMSIMLPKGKRERVKQRASALGKSVNAYVNDLIDRDIEGDSK